MDNDVLENPIAHEFDLVQSKAEVRRLKHRELVYKIAYVLTMPISVVILLLLPLPFSLFWTLGWIILCILLGRLWLNAGLERIRLSGKIQSHVYDQSISWLTTSLEHVVGIFDILWDEDSDDEDSDIDLVAVTQKLNMLSEYWNSQGFGNLSENLELFIQESLEFCQGEEGKQEIRDEVSDLLGIFTTIVTIRREHDLKL